MPDFHLTHSNMRLTWVAGPTASEALRNLADALDALNWSEHVMDLHFSLSEEEDDLFVVGAFVELPA